MTLCDDKDTKGTYSYRGTENTSPSKVVSHSGFQAVSKSENVSIISVCTNAINSAKDTPFYLTHCSFVESVITSVIIIDAHCKKRAHA